MMSPEWKANVCVKAWTRTVIKTLFPHLFWTPVLLLTEQSDPQWISKGCFWGRVFNLLPALLVIHSRVDDKDQLQPGGWKGLLGTSTGTTGMVVVRGGSGVHQKLK